MRRFAVCVACSFLAAMVIAGFSATAQAKPGTVLDGVFKAWQGKALILEIRKCMDDKTYEFTMLQDGKITMLRSAPGKPPEVLETNRTYNMEKIKALKGAAGNAMWIIMKQEDLQGKAPTIRAITLRENEKGALEFLVHLYHPADGAYRRTMIVDSATWQVDKDGIEVEDPRTEVWDKGGAEGEAPAGGATEASEGEAEEPAKEAAKPGAAASDKPKGGTQEK